MNEKYVYLTVQATATAAWKMCIGLACNLAATQKRLRLERMEARKGLQTFFHDLVLECADRAIDFLHSLSFAERRAEAHFRPVARRWVFRNLRNFVAEKRVEETKRVNGDRALAFSDIKKELTEKHAQLPSFVERGRVFVVGSNEFGQLGVCKRKEDVREIHTPMCVFAVDGDRIRQMVATPRYRYEWV